MEARTCDHNIAGAKFLFLHQVTAEFLALSKKNIGDDKKASMLGKRSKTLGSFTARLAAATSG